MIKVEIYAKNGCCLCKEVNDTINRVSRDIKFSCKVIDITKNEELLRRYKGNIPTIFINSKKVFKFKVDETEFRKKLKKEIIRATLLNRCRGKIKESENSKKRLPRTLPPIIRT